MKKKIETMISNSLPSPASKQLLNNLSIALSVLFSTFCLVVGSIILWITLSDLLEARQSRKWPSCKGVIDESHAEFNTGNTGTGFSQVIKYHFILDNVRYVGTRLDYNKRSTKTKAESEMMLSPFPMGSSIPVYYDPKAPKRNTLIPGPSLMTYIPPIFGILPLLLGIAILLHAVLKIRAAERSALESVKMK